VINKLSTYIGFAKKSKQILIGTDNILSSNKCKVVIASEDLSVNAKKKIENKFKVLSLNVNDFQSVIKMDSVKVIAITDENLANAIRNLLEVQ
jgi:hypothetical protein